MGSNEVGTLSAVNRHRKKLTVPKVRQFNGGIGKVMSVGKEESRGDLL
jgi:hypothetical protein